MSLPLAPAEKIFSNDNFLLALTVSVSICGCITGFVFKALNRLLFTLIFFKCFIVVCI